METAAADWEQAACNSGALEVFLLGRIDLASVLALQSRLADQLAVRTDTHGFVLVCEHSPAITIGREGSFADVLVEREELISRQMDVRWVNRGGGCFVQAPGQVAVYPIVPLDRLKFGLLDFRCRLEQSLIQAAEDLDVLASRSEGTPGAICRCGQFAFIGCGVRSWVTHGGMVINVSTPQEALDLVRWSNSDVRVTTIASQRLRPTAMSTVRESVVRNLAAALGYGDYQLCTGHPLLRRSTRKVYVFA